MGSDGGTGMLKLRRRGRVINGLRVFEYAGSVIVGGYPPLLCLAICLFNEIGFISLAKYARTHTTPTVLQ